MTRPTPRQWVYAALAALLVVAIGFYFLTRDANQKAETSDTQRDAAVGAAEQVIDCIADPAVESTRECEAEAQDAQEVLEETVPPVGLTGRQRREVIILAAELIAAQPQLTEDDVVDEVLSRLPEAERGPRGRRGATGLPGAAAEPPTTAEVRALVEAVYQADPPAPGDDGTKGDAGATGQPGKDGKDATPEMIDDAVARYCSVRGECIGPAGPQGDTGPTGPTGATGPPGAPGRGIAAIECDSATPFTLTVTYGDGTTTTYSCGPALDLVP